MGEGATSALLESKELAPPALASLEAQCCWKLLTSPSPARQRKSERGQVDMAAPVVQILLSPLPSLGALPDSLSASAEEALERALARRMLLTLHTQ